MEHEHTCFYFSRTFFRVGLRILHQPHHFAHQNSHQLRRAYRLKAGSHFHIIHAFKENG